MSCSTLFDDDVVDAMMMGPKLASLFSPFFLHSFQLSILNLLILSLCMYVFKKVCLHITHIYFAFSSLSAHEQASRGCRTEQNMKGREKRAFNVGKLDLGREA